MSKILYDMSSADYHKHTAVSRSGLMDLNVTPKYYWYKHLSGEYEPKDTDATSFGTAFHTALLEPEKIDQQYYVWSGQSRTTKKGKAEWAEANEKAGKRKIIEHDDLETIKKIAASILTEPAGKQLFRKKGFVEPSCFWTDEQTGIEVKARPDFMLDGGDVLVDLKTSLSATVYDFQRSIVKYGYDIQAYMQMQGVFKATGQMPALFVFVVVEKTAPYHTAFYVADAEMIDCGRMRYNRLINLLKACKERNQWPGYGQALQNITVPRWLIEKELETGV